MTRMFLIRFAGFALASGLIGVGLWYAARPTPAAQQTTNSTAFASNAEVPASQPHPGPVTPAAALPRRLSNAEFNYAIRDLTGVDMQPAREFPDSEAGFGASSTMPPELLKIHLAAARLVADHVVLKPQGFVFAPRPMTTDADRDQYCVKRILDFYKAHAVDYADYFLAAWRYHHRGALGRPASSLDEYAAEAGLSEKYLAAVWSAFTEVDAETGPLAAVRKLWQDLPAPATTNADAARPPCARLRALVVHMRQQLRPNLKRVSGNGSSSGSQAIIFWNNQAQARQRRHYAGDVSTDLKKLAEQLFPGADPDLVSLFPKEMPDAAGEKRLREELEQFCSVFPDQFFVANDAEHGQPLTAGSHFTQGYFRDDGPLCELVLNDAQRHELDALWIELNFITAAPIRQIKDFILCERSQPPHFLSGPKFEFVSAEDSDAASEAKVRRLAEAYLAKAREHGAAGDAENAIKAYFASISAEIRAVEQGRRAAEPSHLKALVRFASRAYRRPLSDAERDDLLATYQSHRKLGRSHEGAVGDTLVSVLTSPHFYYRSDLAASR